MPQYPLSPSNFSDVTGKPVYVDCYKIPVVMPGNRTQPTYEGILFPTGNVVQMSRDLFRAYKRENATKKGEIILMIRNVEVANCQYDLYVSQMKIVCRNDWPPVSLTIPAAILRGDFDEQYPVQIIARDDTHCYDPWLLASP